MEWPVGGVGIYDLEASPRVRNYGPVDWVHHHVPRSTLEAFADKLEIPDVQALQCSFGTADPVLHRMTQMILPSLNARAPISKLFLDYCCLLFCAHVTKAYASSSIPVKVYRGGLAPWQKRRAIELLRNHLDGSVRLTTLAEECGLRQAISHCRSDEPLGDRHTNTWSSSASKKQKHHFRTPCALFPKRLCKRGFPTKLHSVELSKRLWEHLQDSGAEKLIVVGLHSRIPAPNPLSPPLFASMITAVKPCWKRHERNVEAIEFLGPRQFSEVSRPASGADPGRVRIGNLFSRKKTQRVARPASTVCRHRLCC